jgi:cyclopropane fatty-acyl-phospholipid synthase-like methyltransferase
MLEIGCGKGDLLSKFDADFETRGIDMAHSAIELASKRGLHVEQSSYEDLDEESKYDIIVSITVIEHVTNPSDFLIKQSKLLNKNGIIILTLPVQDNQSHDVYMLDHLWHFHSNHIKLLADQSGLFILNFSVGHKVIDNIATLILCKKEDVPYYARHDNKYIRSFNYMFDRLNAYVNKNIKKQIFIYGNGEYSKFLQAYSDINKIESLTVIEDNPKYVREGSITFNNFSESYAKIEEHLIILAMNKNYHNDVINKFKNANFERVEFFIPQNQEGKDIDRF